MHRIRTNVLDSIAVFCDMIAHFLRSVRLKRTLKHEQDLEKRKMGLLNYNFKYKL